MKLRTIPSYPETILLFTVGVVFPVASIIWVGLQTHLPSYLLYSVGSITAVIVTLTVVKGVQRYGKLNVNPEQETVTINNQVYDWDEIDTVKSSSLGSSKIMQANVYATTSFTFGVGTNTVTLDSKMVAKKYSSNNIDLLQKMLTKACVTEEKHLYIKSFFDTVNQQKLFLQQNRVK